MTCYEVEDGSMSRRRSVISEISPLLYLCNEIAFARVYNNNVTSDALTYPIVSTPHAIYEVVFKTKSY